MATFPRAAAAKLLEGELAPEYQAGLRILAGLRTAKRAPLAEAHWLLVTGAHRQLDDEGFVDPAVAGVLQDLRTVLTEWKEAA